MPQRDGSVAGSERLDAVHWRPWGAAAFHDASSADRPVLLNLTASWCHWCRLMDETTYADPELIALVNSEFVPIRVDADRYPHVEYRYIAGGWPTNAFLTPTGEVLWAGTFVEADEFRGVARNVLAAWKGRRDELDVEIQRRRKALEAARSHRPRTAIVRREAADDVLAAIEHSYDPRNGGFGTAPKFPNADAIELLYVQERRLGGDWGAMADHTLDGMLAGELWDELDGGFFRYALAADWTQPRREKLLDTNAAMLVAYALGAHVRGRADWRRVAERIVGWVEGTLARPDGLWSGSQMAAEEYYALPADARARAPRPGVDATVFTDSASHWIRALAVAGPRLGHHDWAERAAEALPRLLSRMAAPGDLLFHYAAPDDAPALAGLLTDLLEAARACIAVAQATGHAVFLEEARRLAGAMQRRLWADGGGFVDHVPSEGDVAALRYRDRPFELNADAARLLLDLYQATGERSYRALAERTLATLSPLAGRYEVAGAAFALGVEEFFEAPPTVTLVGSADATAELRAAALALPLAERRVWTVPDGGRLPAGSFPPQPAPAAYFCSRGACSPALRDGAGLADAARRAR
ncbi:MAG: thioredoxin domain-containing protein [Gemmatimonadetes bacterium]|nr:thioredoxin domain-containing protein [Gemmatimonadota bacterium]